MDRLTEFVSKSFDGRHEEEVNSDNNNSKTICTSVDMSKETLDREALERAAREYDDHVNVTGDHNVTSDDAQVDHHKPASPAPASSTTLTPATTARDISRPGVAEALLHHRAAFQAHKDASIISEFTQRHPFGIDSLSVKLQENAAAAAAVAAVASSSSTTRHDRSSSSPVPSPPGITIPTTVSACVSSASLPTSLCSSSTSLSLPSYPRPLVSPSCNKGLFLLFFLQVLKGSKNIEFAGYCLLSVNFLHPKHD